MQTNLHEIKSLSVFLGSWEMEKVRGRDCKGHEETIEGDGNVHHLDCGTYFMDVYIYLYLN